MIIECLFLQKKHLNDSGNSIELKEELDRIEDDLAIISNWFKSRTECLKKLYMQAECASQTEKSSSLRDASVQTEKSSRKSSTKKHDTQSEKNNSTATKETVATKNGVESTHKKRKRESDIVSLTNSHPPKKKAKSESVKEKDQATLKIPNKEKKDKTTLKKDKESNTKSSAKNETARSHSASLKKSSKTKEVATVAVKNPLDIQLKQTAETLCLEMPSQPAEEETVTGLLTPASESLLNTDDNRESVECKIDIVEADLKAELISPSNHIAVESPVVYGTPKTNQLLAVKKTVEVLKVCSLCEHTMYSASEIRRHRLQHMKCNYCKKKFRSLKSTYVHSTYECEQNPLMCRVSLTKIDTWKNLCDNYPTAFSQLREGRFANVAKKKTSYPCAVRNKLVSVHSNFNN